MPTDQSPYESLFGTHELSLSEEADLIEGYDTSMDPREWMARNGHNILCGDLRFFKWRDKAFEAWIYRAYEALTSEGLEKLWKEFLTDEEITIVREQYENP